MTKHSAIRRAAARLVEALEARQHLHGDVNLTFQFQPEGTPLVNGTIADFGNVYGDRGSGLTYGWTTDSRDIMRDRNATSDQSHDTLAQLQQGGNHTWQLQMPDGEYQVTLVSGDSKYLDGQDQIKVNDQRVMYGVQSEKKRYLTASAVITVTDGLLSVRPETTGVNTKLISLSIKTFDPGDPLPVVTISAPVPNASEDGVDGTIRVTRSVAALDDPLVVDLAWSGSAGKKDIVSRPSSVTIPAGDDHVDISVVPIDDDVDEALETATATLVPDAGIYDLGTKVKASIAVEGAEHPAPHLGAVTVNAIDSEATEGGGTALIRFSRGGDDDLSQLVVPISWSGSAGSSDLNRPSTITIPSGAATVDLTITAIDDSVVETDETATVTLSTPASGANYILGTQTSASIVIHDNDVAPPSPSFSNITWHSTTAPPISYSETTSITIANKIYLFGGFNGVFSPQSNVYRFDGTTWTTMKNSPVAFTHVGATEVNGKMWIAGGYIGNGKGGQIFGTTDVRIYDPATDSWSLGPSLPSGRAAGNLVKVDHTLYFFGGETQNRTADSTTMWALDLNNQSAGWTTKASMPMSRNHTAALVINGKIYAMGGQTGFDDGLTAHNDIQIYDPASNSWTVSTKKLPGPRSHTVNAVQYYEEKIIILGGESAHNVPQNNVWSIDPSTLVTTALGNFPDSRLSIASGIINGKLYAFGGYKGAIATTSYVGTFA